MNPEKTAEIIQQAAGQTQDPIFVGLAWVLGIMVMIIAITKPIMGMVRQYRSDRAENAKDGADETLYKQLKEQIEMNARDIRTLIEEKNKWQELAINLRARVEQLEHAEETIMRMKENLDQKDKLIMEYASRNQSMMDEMIRMKDRIHHLEMRLSNDEKQFCSNCRYREAIA